MIDAQDTRRDGCRKENKKKGMVSTKSKTGVEERKSADAGEAKRDARAVADKVDAPPAKRRSTGAKANDETEKADADVIVAGPSEEALLAGSQPVIGLSVKGWGYQRVLVEDNRSPEDQTEDVGLTGGAPTAESDEDEVPTSLTAEPEEMERVEAAATVGVPGKGQEVDSFVLIHGDDQVRAKDLIEDIHKRQIQLAELNRELKYKIFEFYAMVKKKL